ncbi:hypothetical protein [Sporosarcina sp. NPDC096371]|uniref:hypothetical protein n=1 Tax=Sporosarcina sp. NPDC096371 TaxID=3364530 RepID=UPI00381E034A
MDLGMWIFWGAIVTLLAGCYIVDFLTGGKYSLKAQEKSLNRNSRVADSLRQVGRNDHQKGPF